MQQQSAPRSSSIEGGSPLRIAGSLPVENASLLTGKYSISARTRANSEVRGYSVGARARAGPKERLTRSCSPCHLCSHWLPQSVPVLAALGGSGRCQLCQEDVPGS